MLGHRFFRSAFLALLLSGIGFSAATPQLTLYLVRELGASLPVAGLFYLTNVAAPIAGLIVGSMSDRSHNRLVIFRICVLAGGLGWLGMALATAIWVPFVISAAVLSISSAGAGQLFAATRDELNRTPSTADNRVVSLIRMAFTAGWVIGPVLGSWFGSVYGLRALLVGTAICVLAQLLPLGRQQVIRFVPEPTPGAAVSTRRFAGMGPLLFFIALCVLVMSGDTIKFAYLPLYMADELRVSDGVRGMVIAIQPLLEFILMPLAAWLADRYGGVRVLFAGCLFGVGAYITYATSSDVVGLFAGQLLTAVLWAALAAVGISVAQALYPQGVGTASSLFMSAMMLAGAVGGAIGGLGVDRLGLPEVFFLPAGLTALGAVGMIALARRQLRE